MKLLCVVNRFLQKCLTDGLNGANLTFCSQWDEAASALTQSQFDFVIIWGELVEDEAHPILLWSAASQLRLLRVPAVFIGLQHDASMILKQFYPDTKQVPYPESASSFFFSLQNTQPDLIGGILDNLNKQDSANGARPLLSSLGSRQRTRNSVSSTSAVSAGRSVAGRSGGPASISKARYSRDSLADISSAPLGLKPPSVGAMRAVPAGGNHSPYYPPINKDDSSSDLQLVVEDISSGISGLSPISSTEISAIDRALRSSGDSQSVSGNIDAGAANSRRSQTPDPYLDTQSSQVKLNSADGEVSVRRSASEFLLGVLEFGTLMRVAMTLKRLKMTGVLEIKNDTRRLHIEYKDGNTFSNSQQLLIESAFTWECGEYNFNAMSMLSRDCTPINIEEIITKVVHEQLSLNPILRALGFEMRHYILVTDCFNPKYHAVVSSPWWEKCYGETRLNDIMGAGELPMDILAKDIYRAWLCDEITFTDVASDKPAKVLYISNPRVNLHDKREKSKLSLDASNDSHLNTIRAELENVKKSFEISDGYTILGLKQGCGTKALDDAYYAWINRYHTDRYIRYKDPGLVQMANDLIMMMNNIYPRLSKSERIGTGISSSHSSSSIPSVSAFDSGVGSPRIGSSRYRISTIDVQTEDKLSKVSRELKAIRSVENDRSYSSANQRVYIRPSSTASQEKVPSQISQPSQEGQRTVRMSDYLAERRAAQSKESTHFRRGSSSFKNKKSGAIRPVQQIVTPEQYFQTGKKKLLLDLIDDAINAFQLAVEGSPDNDEYRVYLSYALAVADPSKGPDTIEALKALMPDAKWKWNSNKTDKGITNYLFSLFYFCGKLEIVSEAYEPALEDFNNAAKVMPDDIDTQRCLRFVHQQIAKFKENAKPKKSFFDSLKGR